MHRTIYHELAVSLKIASEPWRSHSGPSHSMEVVFLSYSCPPHPKALWEERISFPHRELELPSLNIGPLNKSPE